MANKDQMSMHNVNVDTYHIITLITSYYNQNKASYIATLLALNLVIEYTYNLILHLSHVSRSTFILLLLTNF